MRNFWINQLQLVSPPPSFLYAPWALFSTLRLSSFSTHTLAHMVAKETETSFSTGAICVEQVAERRAQIRMTLKINMGIAVFRLREMETRKLNEEQMKRKTWQTRSWYFLFFKFSNIPLKKGSNDMNRSFILTHETTWTHGGVALNLNHFTTVLKEHHQSYGYQGCTQTQELQNHKHPKQHWCLLSHFSQHVGWSDVDMSLLAVYYHHMWQQILTGL